MTFLTLLFQVTLTEEAIVPRFISILLTLATLVLPTSTNASIPVSQGAQFIGILGGVSAKELQRVLKQVEQSGVRIVSPSELTNLPGTTFANLENRSRTWGLAVPIRSGKAVVWMAVTPGPKGINARTTTVYANRWTRMIAASHRVIDPVLPNSLMSPEARAELIVQRLRGLLVAGRTGEVTTGMK
jgi:hypothetical protein